MLWSSARGEPALMTCGRSLSTLTWGHACVPGTGARVSGFCLARFRTSVDPRLRLGSADVGNRPGRLCISRE